ncbi:MAG: type II CAAX prenyl endopeptidase Rce1 family protein [Candidatus Thorarchaeota archaeon]
MLSEIDKESKTIRIQNRDLIYPFALLLFMLFFSDLAAYMTILIILTFNPTILKILTGIFPGIDADSIKIVINIIINLISQMCLIIIFVLLYQNKKVEPEEKSMPTGSHSITLILIYAMLALFTFGIALLSTILSELGFSFESPYAAFEPTLALLGEPIFYVLFFSFYILGAAISEELVFRRAFIPFLERRGLGTFWVLLVSSLLFSLMHSPQDLLFGSIGFFIIHFFGTFAGGFALGFLYMRTRKIIWPMILHGLNNGVAAVAQIGLARREHYDDSTLLFLYLFWILIALMVGAASGVYFLIQTIRSRGSISPPTWFKILTDRKVRSSRIQPILLISLGFIGITSGFPIVFNILDYFLDPLVVYILETTAILILLGLLALFIFKRVKPLEEPDWVSEITFPERSIPGYPYSYSPPAIGPQKFCGSCGREIIPQTSFCVYCGEKIAKICVSCGQEIVPNSEFCVHCGRKV